jgi:hypothetical protein
MKPWMKYGLAGLVGLVVGVAGAGGSTTTKTKTVTLAAAQRTVTAAEPVADSTPEVSAKEKARRAKAKAAKERARKRTEARARVRVEARHKQYLASLQKHFSGNGGLTLEPFTLRRDSILQWTATPGGYFGIYDIDAVPVNSTGSSGKTFFEAGRHKLQVNATGSWTITITPR